MSATTVLLTVERFSEKVGVHASIIAAAIRERRLRPAFMSGKFRLFRVEQIEEAKQLLSLRTERCQRLLTGRDICQRAGITISTLSRAILSGKVVPDYSTEGARRFYFFVEDRVDEIRSVIGAICPKTRKKTAPLGEQSLLPIEGGST